MSTNFQPQVSSDIFFKECVEEEEEEGVEGVSFLADATLWLFISGALYW